jgi:hypothetical protein
MRYLLLLLVLVAGLAQAADYAREKKWADEITPGIVVGEPLYLDAAGHKFLGLYTEAPKAKAAAIVVHGMGVHPDWELIGVLRSQLADLGYTTLSIQMPVLAADAKAEAYSPTFREAAERLKAATAFLKAKGYGKIAIVSHSMGSRMSRRYLAAYPDAPIAAWVAIGMRDDYRDIRVPVLDLYGQNDLPAVLATAKKRAASLHVAGSRQIEAPGADHFFADHDTELVRYVKEFLDGVLGE